MVTEEEIKRLAALNQDNRPNTGATAGQVINPNSATKQPPGPLVEPQAPLPPADTPLTTKSPGGFPGAITPTPAAPALSALEAGYNPTPQPSMGRDYNKLNPNGAQTQPLAPMTSPATTPQQSSPIAPRVQYENGVAVPYKSSWGPGGDPQIAERNFLMAQKQREDYLANMEATQRFARQQLEMQASRDAANRDVTEVNKWNALHKLPMVPLPFGGSGGIDIGPLGTTPPMMQLMSGGRGNDSGDDDGEVKRKSELMKMILEANKDNPLVIAAASQGMDEKQVGAFATLPIEKQQALLQARNQPRPAPEPPPSRPAAPVDEVTPSQPQAMNAVPPKKRISPLIETYYDKRRRTDYRNVV